MDDNNFSTSLFEIMLKSITKVTYSTKIGFQSHCLLGLDPTVITPPLTLSRRTL